MKTLVICASSSHYEQVSKVRDELEALGFKVIVPKSVNRMRDAGDFSRENYQEDFTRNKSDLIRSHFDEIPNGDCVLVLNYEKNGKANYIGGNVFLEMGLAFYLKKPIYVLNNLPDYVPYYDELIGFNPTVLQGNLSLLKTA